MADTGQNRIIGDEPAVPVVDEPLTLPTIAERPSAKPDAEAAFSLPRSLDGSDLTVSRAVDAMRTDEIERARVFYKVILGLVVLIGMVLPFVDGDPTARWVFLISLGVYVASETVFVRAIRDPRQYNDRNLMLLGTTGIFAGYAGVFFFGVFSPAPAIIVMAIYFNSLVGSFRYTLYVYASCAVAQAVLVILIITHTIGDRGLVTADQLTDLEKLVTQSLVQAALFSTFLIARLSRRVTLTSVERLEAAVRDIAQREAIINEARMALERAGGIGDPGRFTEQDLGNYRLGVVIGRGAMGEVYDAIHVDTNRRAAVKLLHRSVLGDSAQVARFAREARAVASLRSPHVVQVFDVADAAAPIPFIAMEKLSGSDLGHYLRQRRRLSADEVVELVTHVGEGIEAARSKDIVHRDLKPQNVFLAELGNGKAVWKILDFGVSKIADTAGTLTHGRIVGTPTYMAPEQALGKDVDHRADVYSLGALSYRAITGHPPFKGPGIPEIVRAVADHMPERPSELCTVPKDVESALAIVLAKKPEHRFQDAREFGRALAAAYRDELGDSYRARAAEILADWPWSSRR